MLEMAVAGENRHPELYTMMHCLGERYFAGVMQKCQHKDLNQFALQADVSR
jgi:hypothetical protein